MPSRFMDVLDTIPENEIADFLPKGNQIVSKFKASPYGQIIDRECGGTGCDFCNGNAVAWLLYYGFLGNGFADAAWFEGKGEKISPICPFRTRVTA